MEQRAHETPADQVKGRRFIALGVTPLPDNMNGFSILHMNNHRGTSWSWDNQSQLVEGGNFPAVTPWYLSSKPRHSDRHHYLIVTPYDTSRRHEGIGHSKTFQVS